MAVGCCLGSSWAPFGIRLGLPILSLPEYAVHSVCLFTPVRVSANRCVCVWFVSLHFAISLVGPGLAVCDAVLGIRSIAPTKQKGSSTTSSAFANGEVDVWMKGGSPAKVVDHEWIIFRPLCWYCVDAS